MQREIGMENFYLRNKIMEKIPIRITWIKNKDEILEPEIILDMEDFFEFEGSITDAIIEFKKKYSKTLKKARKCIPQKNTCSSKDFWNLSKILLELKNATNDKFIITNFNEALEQDFLFTDSYVIRILEFAKYYKKREILDSISFSYYVELNQKKIKLEKIGMFVTEKRRLLKMGKMNNLPKLMTYRKQLQKLMLV